MFSIKAFYSAFQASNCVVNFWANGRTVLMKTTQILYLLLLVVAIVWVANSAHLLDFKLSEGFASGSVSQGPVSQGPVPVMPAEPIIPKIISPIDLKTTYLPDPRVAGQLPYGPYAQQASVGSYPYKDPSLLAANVQQMKMLFEDIRGFLAFQGDEVANSSDPTVSLPLTQLRSDNRRLQQEIAVLDRNPGIESSLTQQDVADIQESLTFLQRKVRLFETSGVITEGFTSSEVKTRATGEDLQTLQSSIYAAMLTLSSSGTVDAVTRARILALQNMYNSITDMINKLDKGIWVATDVPVYKEDIAGILPNLANPAKAISSVIPTTTSTTGSASGSMVNTPIGEAIASLVGPSNVDNVLKNFAKNGNFNVGVSFGYNALGKSSSTPTNYNASFNVESDGNVTQNSGSSGSSGSATDLGSTDSGSTDSGSNYTAQVTGSPFDSSTPSYLDKSKSSLDWKMRNKAIAEQIRKRGLDPADFGCLPSGSVLSPAFSWRGHTKMICGRLGATLDPGLPQACGCPPDNWSGWSS